MELGHLTRMGETGQILPWAHKVLQMGFDLLKRGCLMAKSLCGRMASIFGLLHVPDCARHFVEELLGLAVPQHDVEVPLVIEM